MSYNYDITYQNETVSIHKPILKWVGGKQKLLEHVIELFPQKMKNYHEPFLGGGSVLLGVLTLAMEGIIEIEEDIYAYDLNPYLIAMYQNIQQEPDKLFEEVEKLKIQINSIDNVKETNTEVRKKIKTLINNISLETAFETQEMCYYWIRKQYNEMTDSEKKSIRGSAHLLFLNKTCFRGLYRVNNGIFNVPYGNYKNPEIINLEQIQEISNLIAPVIFECESFEDSLSNVKKHDFVYLDPPYAPEDKDSFVDYTQEGFDLEKHELLFNKIKKLKSKFLLSNSKVDLVTESFTADKYKIKVIETRRAINSKKPDAKTQEVLIYS